MPLTTAQRGLCCVIVVLLVALVVLLATPKRRTASPRPSKPLNQVLRAPPPRLGAQDTYSPSAAIIPAMPSGIAHFFQELGYVETLHQGVPYIVSFTIAQEQTTYQSVHVNVVTGSNMVDFTVLTNAVVSRTGYFAADAPPDIKQEMFESTQIAGVLITFQLSCPFKVSANTPRYKLLQVKFPNVDFTKPYPMGPIDLNPGKYPNLQWSVDVLTQVQQDLLIDTSRFLGIDFEQRVFCVLSDATRAAKLDMSGFHTPPGVTSSPTLPWGHINVSVMDVVRAALARGPMRENIAIFAYTSYPSGYTGTPSEIEALAQKVKKFYQPQVPGLVIRPVVLSDLAMYAAFAIDTDFCVYDKFLIKTMSDDDKSEFPWLPLAWREGATAKITQGWKNAPQKAWIPLTSMPSSAQGYCSRYGSPWDTPNTNGMPKLLYQNAINQSGTDGEEAAGFIVMNYGGSNVMNVNGLFNGLGYNSGSYPMGYWNGNAILSVPNVNNSRAYLYPVTLMS